MAKTFRLYTGADITHWQDRGGDYNNETIKFIQGGDEDKAKNFPTSIPSPFARMDLFRAALASFESASMKLDGDSNNHRIISECLDLLELLYNYDNISSRLEIIVWDRNIHLPALQKSTSAGHKLLAKTLNLYFNQDKESFQFDEFKRFYIFLLDGYVLGGTSPKSIVFTTANSKEFAKHTFDNDTLFSGVIKPLYARNREFIKYIFTLFEAYPQLKHLMPEFYGYLKKNKEYLQATDLSFFHELSDLNESNLNDFEEISFDNLRIEVFGFPLRKIRKSTLIDDIQKDSEFLIHTDKPFTGPTPMVLANNGNLSHLNYLNSNTKWDVNQKVENIEIPLERRVLPGKSIVYPYYHYADFLAEEIYETPYKLNSKFFFDGNFSNQTDDNDVGYLLPLKSLFFELFTINDLINKRFAGKPMMEIVKRKSRVDVYLRIPINKGRDFIELTRRYEDVGVSSQSGKIVLYNQYLRMFPFKKSSIKPNYYINIIDESHSDINGNLTVEFDNKKASKASRKSKTGQNGSFYNTFFYRLQHNFDTISICQVDSKEANVLIPIWASEHAAGGNFTFAIDFGTSNTHVEYTVNNGFSKALNYKNESAIFGQTFIALDPEKQELFDQEFLPDEISAQSAVNFPIRSVLFDFKNYQPNNFQSILDYNIGFYYEKKLLLKSNSSRAISNLKWINATRNRDEQDAQVRSFLEQIIVMCKNKVLEEDGDIRKSKFIWSYPMSYGTHQIKKVETDISELIEIHFGTHIQIDKVCESVAPFYAISKEGKILGSSNTILSIDIGGGTVDSVTYQNQQVKNVTSMIFGANYIYANGYETALNTNTFYQIGEQFIASLSQENQHKVKSIKSGIEHVDQDEEAYKMSNLISYYFSIENHKEFAGMSNISFSKFLANDENLRAIYLFYYASLIYFNIKSLRLQGISKPDKIIFSGNGSKLLHILDSSKSNHKEILEEYTDFIIRWIYEEMSSVTVLTSSHPKELTAQGAVLLPHEDETVLASLSSKNINKIFTTYLGDADNSIIDYAKEMKYDDISLENLESVYHVYEDFVKMFFATPLIKDLFGIERDLKKILQDVLLHKKRALEFLEAGISRRRKQVAETDNIADPLFFYIIRGMLNDSLRVLIPNEN
ncbi:hypothetical protein [Sphingobacterium humi]|uniref:Ppx/GppA phosphatase domain-containing protein n=1 Tax=Sphingobacterium humi TaxID=1796905 RepID=A0A6N8KTX4_9SPHI|nr:hypothetical protein [Sphingobacterium humi]MVZ60537.1 hypothetical protein [Sphingobacterium humi]